MLKTHIDVIGECHIWRGPLTRAKYPLVSFEGRQHYAHRLACEVKYGPLKALHALHHCDNPSCINPDHLFVGTAKDNAQDMVKKGRARNVVFLGSANKFAKLDERKVSEMRNRRSNGETLSSLAKSFGVCKSAVAYAVKIGWRHVQ